MPDPIPTRSAEPADIDEDIIPLSVDDITTLRDHANPDRTGPHRLAGPLDLPVLPGYVIEGELGRGGMGVVYQARHVKLNRPAALKMVLGAARADSKEIIRFLAEAEAVAAVRHPHVVGVYEFGEADGRPYLALEFCPGGSLAQHLASGGRKPPVEAANLVRKLADGVAAAHDLGIVHRDLKPGNVLFDEHGEPKVSDFGLAKRGAGADVTHSQAVMGSPAYMSPEQAKGESKFVGPQADVWALGVILYECLTGTRPFRADDSWSLLQKVITEEPAGVRTITRAVPRDLDLICRKCLAKAPHERYATAAELADDLGRHLAGKPIAARPAGLVERSWKWMKRNKPAVLVMGALALGIVGTTLGLVRAGNEAANARAAADNERKARATADEVATFMRTVFAGENPRGEGRRPRDVNKPRTVKEAMDEAAKTIEGKFGDRPEVEAAVRNTIGVTYQELAAYAEARPQFEKALVLREAVLGPDHLDTLTSVHNLAYLLKAKGDLAAAEPLYRRALAAMEKTLGPDHPDTVKSVNNLADLLHDKGDYEGAEPLYRRALAGREKVLGPDHPDTLASVNNLAIFQLDKGDLAAAEPLLRRGLAGREQALGPDHPDTLQSINNLAELLVTKGDYEGAEPLYRRTLAGREKGVGPDHPDTLQSVISLATLFFRKGDFGAAEPLYRRALAGFEKVLGPDHWHTLTGVNNLAELLRAKGDYGEAEPLYRRALERREKTLGPDHPETLNSVNNLAVLFVAKEDLPAAESLMRRALAGQEKTLGPDHPATLNSVNNLASLLEDKGDMAAAERFYRRALAGFEKAFGPDHPETLTSVNNLAYLLQAKGDLPAAEPLYRRALAGREKALGPDHLHTLTSVAQLALLHVAMKRYADAIPLLDRAARGYAKRPEMEQAVPSLRAELGMAQLADGRPAEAEPHLLAGYEGLSKQKAPNDRNRNRLWAATTGLVELYESTDQPAKAAECRAKLAALPPEVAPRPRAAK